MTHSDDDFSALFSDVTPLEQDQHQQPSKQMLDSESARQRRKDASSTNEEHDPLTTGEVAMLDPHDVISFQRPGTQHGVFRKLRLGQYQNEASLDLHRKNLEEARRAIVRFIADCQKAQIRTTIIIHGKGERSTPPAMMKSHVNHWLRLLPEVMAFHSCQKQDGGSGSLYVMLKKSSAAKQKNRELHQKQR